MQRTTVRTPINHSSLICFPPFLYGLRQSIEKLEFSHRGRPHVAWAHALFFSNREKAYRFFPLARSLRPGECGRAISRGEIDHESAGRYPILLYKYVYAGTRRREYRVEREINRKTIITGTNVKSTLNFANTAPRVSGETAKNTLHPAAF